MNEGNLTGWLLENGGPAVSLNLEKTESGKSKYVLQLSVIEKVKEILDLLDTFDINSMDAKTLEHLIHYYKETCIDHFFPKLIEMGFYSDISLFDKKMTPLRKIFSRLGEQYYAYKLMLCRFYFMAGYDYDEVIDFALKRLELICVSASEKTFDIYENKDKLPKLPAHWMDKPVLKDILNPYCQVKPLPLFYDIEALSYFPERRLNSDIRKKIDDVIYYILEPEFQKIQEGYGLIWSKSKRRYYACGWNPLLPYFNGYERPVKYEVSRFLFYFDMMSRFEIARNSKWFSECLARVEKYRTVNGTYIFPKELTGKKFIHEAFLSASNLKLNRKEQELKTREITSTMYMMKILKRVNITQT
jgi:hypothetical protein